MSIHRLDNNIVKTVRHAGKYSDGGGLYLYVGDGSKSWVFRYSRKKFNPKEGDPKEGYIGIGSTNDYTLEEARAKAYEYRKQLKDGIDPLHARDKARIANQREAAGHVTVAQVCDYYLEYLEKKQQKKNGSIRNWRQAESCIRRFIKPAIGDRAIELINEDDNAAIIRPVMDATPAMGKALKDHLHAIFKRAKAKHWFPLNRENPASLKGRLAD